ncbi:hypothetical protein EC991_006650 [Linnemannia zychae]|nr:hypothetical protein EC991_006650 [Linnemannia zychae]
METSDLTILLFFLIVLFFLATFILYIFISRRTTPASQRLTQWLKAQSEADLLVETMASQGQCVLEGLHPCRRRDKTRKRQAAQRRRQHAENGRGNGEDAENGGGSGSGGAGGAGSSGGGGEYDEEMAMDELWRRYQRQRPEDPATLVVHGAITSGDSGNSNGVGNGVSSEGDSAGARIDHRTEDMVAEKLWEYVVGWCLIGCILCGMALIAGANFSVHGDPAKATPWTFEPEDGDSLMDTIVANIMKAALGMQDFEDQLMEHGIFVFIVGINGFVLVRQRVFGRRRQHEQELMRGGLLPIEAVKNASGLDSEGKGGSGGEMVEDKDGGGGEGFSEGKRDFYEDVHLHHHQGVQGVERFTTTDQIPAQTVGASTSTTTAILTRVGIGGPIEHSPNANNADPRSTLVPTIPPIVTSTTGAATTPKGKETSATHPKEQVEDKKGNGDNSPDFATMSFLAWFNYLQVGILIIEFLQLFSFPLRELMEFYNQAEKTSAMYEGAKTILDVFKTTALGDGQVSSSGGSGGASGIHYKDGILSIGNNTLFDFNPKNSSAQDKKSTEGPSFALEISEGDESGIDGSKSRAAVLDQHSEGMDLAASIQAENKTSMTSHQSSVGGGGGGTQKLGASVDWIKENLPSWLPNITALMDNNTVDGLAPGRFEELRDNLVNAAVGVALQGFSGANSSTTGSDATGTLSSVNAVGSGDSTILKPHTGRPGSSSNSGGDGDIVMQVVNSLGLQPSINTHDWYLLRFWSCFAAVALGWIVALSIHAWNRRCRRLRREGRPHWNAISVGWVSCFIPVVSVLYLPILSTFLSSAACQSQAIHAYAHEKYAQQQEQARRLEGPGSIQATGVFSSVIMTLLDPASTVAPSASSLLCTGPHVRPALYLIASLFAYTLAYVLFMVFLTSFERVPAKGEICFRPNGVAVLKNLGLLLAVDFLLIQSPSQRRFRGLVSIGIMLAMACYTIRMKPCYWNKINYWRTFSFSCVLYASLLVALLCPSPVALEKSEGSGSKSGKEHGAGLGRWVMAPHLKMGLGWMVVGGGPKVMLAWIAAGWVLLVIVFVVVERVFLRHWTKKVAPTAVSHIVVRPLLPSSDGYGYRGGGGGVDLYGGPMFRNLQGGGGGEMGAFAPATPGGGAGTSGLSINLAMSGSHWSVVDLSQTPEARRKSLGSSNS